MTPDLARRMYDDIKLKNPEANVSLQDIAGGYVGKTLSEALLKATIGKGSTASDMCAAARELLVSVTAQNIPLCSRTFQDIAQELSCDAVQELLDALGAQGMISGCTWYY
ncbi:MAG: hypothetical protein HY609_03990, partial [Deltaproteobacteria bacterium]|nr:hypothetical protein [Deltaproteobacteria bacterium]